MRKVFGMLLVVALLAAACGDDDGGGGLDPAAADSCEELADIGINLMQDAIDAMDEMSLADFMALTTADELPPELARFETIGEDLEARGDQLGCTAEEGDRLMCERIGKLSADGEVGQLMVAGIAGEC